MSSCAGVDVSPFEYPADGIAPDSPWTDIPILSEDGAAGTQPSAVEPIETVSAGKQLELDREMHSRFESGRKHGFEEGVKAERDTQAARIRTMEETHCAQLQKLMVKFEAARDLYLREVEQEVVALALAVAAGILRREAQMDPLLLTGAVRVALGQLAEATRVQLHVPQQEQELWSEALAHIPHLKSRPEVIADDGLRPGDCSIETEIGSVDLGLRAQLGEIEKGFFDSSRAKRTALRATPIASSKAEPGAEE